MYPLKFTRVLKEKIWGGRDFTDFPRIALPSGNHFGESWEVSAHEHGVSIIANGSWAGQSLAEVMNRQGAALVGPRAWQRYGARFPLLIKYLDIHDQLSIQVHPDDDYARQHEADSGKSECWYIVQASPDARFVLGLRPEVTAQQLQTQIAQHDWSNLFREIPLEAGDFLHITPGTVHASLQGSFLVYEVQQTSDLTYRLYDFDRLENGQARPLHLEKALQVIRYGEPLRCTKANQRRQLPLSGARLEPLVRDPHYTVDLVHVDQQWVHPAQDSFQIFSVLNGSGSMLSDTGEAALVLGDTWFIPAGVAVAFRGPCTLIRSGL